MGEKGKRMSKIGREERNIIKWTEITIIFMVQLSPGWKQTDFVHMAGGSRCAELRPAIIDYTRKFIKLSDCGVDTGVAGRTLCRKVLPGKFRVISLPPNRQCCGIQTTNRSVQGHRFLRIRSNWFCANTSCAWLGTRQVNHKVHTVLRMTLFFSIMPGKCASKRILCGSWLKSRLSL